MCWTIGPSASSTGNPAAITLSRAVYSLEQIQCCGPNFHYLYENSSSHSIAPGNLHNWGIGSKITDAEWTRSGGDRYRGCFTRNQPIQLEVSLGLSSPSHLANDVEARLWVLPTIDGSSSYLTGSSEVFTIPAGSSNASVRITTGGRLPQEVGRYILRCRWRVTSVDGTQIYVIDYPRTRQYIYGIYGQAKMPDYDSHTLSDPGVDTTAAQGTLTGTQKRFDHLMRLIGGRLRRCIAATAADINNMIWRLHRRINDTPGVPPYFDGGHGRCMADDGANGTEIPVVDQWLAWVRTRSERDASGRLLPPDERHWNDISCIGHVQLLKTMLAAIGFFARRSWVLPHTSRKPDGTTYTLTDSDLYALGEYDVTKEQKWSFIHNSISYTAICFLIEPEYWEYFEACTVTSNGRFLPGGYNTHTLPRSIRQNKGFASARELLQWWSRTIRRRWGGRALPRPFNRFLAWVYENESTGEIHYWDKNGAHYDEADRELIRDSGNDLPLP